MKRQQSHKDVADSRMQYDRGAWASRRSPGDSEGGETEPESETDEGPSVETGRAGGRRAPIGLTEALMPLESLSTEELQRELARRQGELKRMLSRRSKLAQQLSELDAQIKALGGEGGAPRGEGRRAHAAAQPRATRTRSKNEITLSDAIAMAVEVRATVTPTEVAQLVQANGYRSTSKNFAMMVANALAKDKRFRRLSRGQYERVV
jgi:hypothetical protein